MRLDSPNAELRIARVTTAADREAVGRLRYAITVAEMGLDMKHADHARQTVVEPLDATGVVLAAWEGDEIVGTVRTNLLRDGDVGSYFDGYALGRFGERMRSRLSITTRLAVRPSRRCGRAFLNLAAAAYAYVLEQGVEYDVIDCRRRLVGNFEHLGYRPHREDFTHPEFGDVAVLALAIRDAEHLRAVRSPFLYLLAESQPAALSRTPVTGVAS